MGYSRSHRARTKCFKPLGWSVKRIWIGRYYVNAPIIQYDLLTSSKIHSQRRFTCQTYVVLALFVCWSGACCRDGGREWGLCCSDWGSVRLYGLFLAFTWRRLSKGVILPFAAFIEMSVQVQSRGRRLVHLKLCSWNLERVVICSGRVLCNVRSHISMRMFYHMLLVTNYSDSEPQRVALVSSACERPKGFAIKLHFSFQKNTVWSCYQCDSVTTTPHDARDNM